MCKGQCYQQFFKFQESKKTGNLTQKEWLDSTISIEKGSIQTKKKIVKHIDFMKINHIEEWINHYNKLLSYLTNVQKWIKYVTQVKYNILFFQIGS